MAGLADMEELLSTISNKAIVDYMREALSCYNNGAYRGCIVMSYIALYDDIRAKLSELAKTNAVAKAISKDVEKRASDQEVFESFMADKIKAEGLITAAEHQRLGVIRDLRNKAAHPSGVHATPEEARFIFRTVISEFLSKQLLKTTHAVDAILDRLGQSNLFPTTQIAEIKAIAADEIGGLHPSAIPYLITKLAESAQSSDAQTSTNAERFVVGLAALRKPEIREVIRNKVIVAKSQQKEHANFIGRLVAADGALLKTLNGQTSLRVNSLLLAVVESGKSRAVTGLGHPAKQLAEMISSIGEDLVLKDYQKFVNSVLERYPYTLELLETLKDAPKISETLIESWNANAGSSTFDTANAFAKALPEIDEVVGDLLSDEDAFRLVVGVNRAADWNAHSSRAVRNAHFSDSPNLVAAAKRYISKNPKAAKTTIESKTEYESLKEFTEANFDPEDEE